MFISRFLAAFFVVRVVSIAFFLLFVALQHFQLRSNFVRNGLVTRSESLMDGNN